MKTGCECAAGLRGAGQGDVWWAKSGGRDAGNGSASGWAVPPSRAGSATGTARNFALGPTMALHAGRACANLVSVQLRLFEQGFCPRNSVRIDRFGELIDKCGKRASVFGRFTVVFADIHQRQQFKPR